MSDLKTDREQFLAAYKEIVFERIKELEDKIKEGSDDRE